VQEFTDLDVENFVSKERASVQIKSETSQAELNEYIEKFESRKQYQRFIFATHKPRTELRAAHPYVHVWTGAKLAELIVRSGLGTWVESKVV
jgi:hypothetical protein